VHRYYREIRKKKGNGIIGKVFLRKKIPGHHWGMAMKLDHLFVSVKGKEGYGWANPRGGRLSRTSRYPGGKRPSFIWGGVSEALSPMLWGKGSRKLLIKETKEEGELGESARFHFSGAQGGLICHWKGRRINPNEGIAT